MRTPETLTAAARADQLRAQGADAMKPDADQERARASLLAGLNLTPVSASAKLDPRLDVDGSFSILGIDDIVPYSKNPRTRPNPRYNELKESIRASHITNPLTVTRRPGEVKYFPYGGGNTRLDIAKSLFAEGDKRFAQLQVIIKPWTSEADVIAAHLAENENRGDTSFWEKALGVKSFKEEWERDHPDELLSTPALNEQMRSMGINYGLKMVQNFQFAFERLEPIGSWLAARDVNSFLRPTLTSYFDLAGKLGRSADADLCFAEILGRHAADLRALEERNAASAPEDAIPLALDSARLVSEVAEGVAKLLSVPTARMTSMAELLHQRPRISAQELRQTQATPQGDLAPAVVGRTPSTGAAHQQQKPTPTEAAPTQLQLGAMAGVVGGQAAPQSNTFAPSPPAASDPLATQVAPSASDSEVGSQTLYDFRLELAHVLFAIHNIVPINDFLKNAPEMPFGFFVDLPEEPLDQLDGETLSPMVTRCREALWLVLASLSGQTQASVWEHYEQVGQTDELRWPEFLALDHAEMSRVLVDLLPIGLGVVTCIDIGATDENGKKVGGLDLMVGSTAYWQLHNHPELHLLMPQLYDVLSRTREAHPSIFDYGAGQIFRAHWIRQD